MTKSSGGFATATMLLMSALILLLTAIAARELTSSDRARGGFIRNMRRVSANFVAAKLDRQLNSSFYRIDPFELIDTEFTARLLPYVERQLEGPTRCENTQIRLDPNLTCQHKKLSGSSITALVDCLTSGLLLADQTSWQNNLCTDNAIAYGQSIFTGYVQISTELTLRGDAILIAAGDIYIGNIRGNNHRLTLISSSGQIQVTAVSGELYLLASASKGSSVPANAHNQTSKLIPDLLGREIVALYPE